MNANTTKTKGDFEKKRGSVRERNIFFSIMLLLLLQISLSSSTASVPDSLSSSILLLLRLFYLYHVYLRSVSRNGASVEEGIEGHHIRGNALLGHEVIDSQSLVLPPFLGAEVNDLVEAEKGKGGGESGRRGEEVEKEKREGSVQERRE